jgi:hypothetical protein
MLTSLPIPRINHTRSFYLSDAYTTTTISGRARWRSNYLNSRTTLLLANWSTTAQHKYHILPHRSIDILSTCHRHPKLYRNIRNYEQRAPHQGPCLYFIQLLSIMLTSRAEAQNHAPEQCSRHISPPHPEHDCCAQGCLRHTGIAREYYHLSARTRDPHQSAEGFPSMESIREIFPHHPGQALAVAAKRKCDAAYGVQ